MIQNSTQQIAKDQTQSPFDINFSEITKSLKKFIWLLELPFDPILSLFTQSISDVLCLETLKHGTSLGNYLNIRIEGADPSHGGKVGGSSANSESQDYREASKGHFYVFKDSGIVQLEFFPIEMQINGDKAAMERFERKISQSSASDLFKHSHFWLPLRTRIHAVASGLSSAVDYMPKRFQLLGKIINPLTAFFTPTVNFRFVPEQLNLDRYDHIHKITNSKLKSSKHTFMEDEDFGGLAWKTKSKISTEYIGLYGIICQAFKSNVINRIKNNPGKSAYGAIRLICLLAISGFAAHRFSH